MLTKQIMHGLFSQVSGTPFAVTYWDGATERYGQGEPVFTLTIRDSNLLGLLQSDPMIGIGEAYMQGRIDVTGDLADMVALGNANAASASWLTQGLTRALAKMGRRSHGQQQQDVARHYDLGNDFFQLWLDPTLTYSCAYFRTPQDSLEAAQRQKIDHSLRKLRLRPEEHLLDIGSGWGALIRRAAQEYDVRALGITLSEEQYAGSCQAIEEAGLADRVDVRLAHYETLAREGRQFDKVISIGMIEHVGQAHLPEFADAVRSLLRPGGLALLHSITSVQEGPINSWIDKYIFPGAYIPTLAELISLYSARDLRILDVENLRPHYQKTLDHWSERFERQTEPIRARYGDEFVRMWRLYLRSSSACFRTGDLEVHQVLVSHGKADGLPLTREDLYRLPLPS